MKAGHEVKVFAEQRQVSGKDDTQKVEVPYVECWNRNIGFSPMAVEVAEFKPDVLHIQHEFGLFCYTPPAANNFLETMNRIKTPKVITYHSVPMAAVPRQFFADYFKDSNPMFGRKIFHSEVARQVATDNYKVTNSIHINHGVKLCSLLDQKESKNILNIDRDAIVLMSMGYFGGLKGVHELIELFHKFKKTHPNSKFLYVGGLHPPTAQYGKRYMLDCMKRIISLNLKDDFKITGYVPEQELPKYYSAANIFILNYINSGYISASGCSAKLVAAKRPIITTKGTFRNEELVDGETCIKVNVGDIEGMLSSVEKFLENKELYNSIVDGAFKYAGENSWENISKKHVKEYEEVTIN